MKQFIYLNNKIIILFFLLIGSGILFGQQDILIKAKQLSAQKKYEQARKLLQKNYQQHPEDLYTAWLYGEVLFQTNRINTAQKVYKKLIQKNPENAEIKIDFAKKLMNNGNLNQAQEYFEQVKNTDKDLTFTIHKSLAQILFWKSLYDEAWFNIRQAAAIYPKDKEVINLKKEIQKARSNWLQIDANLFLDDQPLTKISPSIKTGIYLNSNLSIGAEVDLPVFNSKDNHYDSQKLQGFARYRLLPIKTFFEVRGGLIYFPSGEKNWIGSLKATSNIWKHLTASLFAEQQPYLSTLASLDNNLLFYKYGITLDWNDPNGWLGKAAYNVDDFYSLNNSIQTESAWVASPKFKTNHFYFRLGYGINYSHTEKNNFESIESLEDITTNWDSTLVINGVYQPFFSPNHQLIHSVIAIFSYQPNSAINLGINVNYGFLATTDIPHLFLNKDIDTEATVIDREFFKQNYHPIDVDFNFIYRISPTIDIKTYYQFQKTNFYTSHTAGITTNILF